MSGSEEAGPLHPHVEVRRFAGKGRGVVARHRLVAGSVIDRSPVVVLPREQVGEVARTVLDNYVLTWGEQRDEVAVVLGIFSLVNHAYASNADFERHPDLEEVWLRAHRDIAEGEEITIDYTDGRTPVWFDVASTGEGA